MVVQRRVLTIGILLGVWFAALTLHTESRWSSDDALWISAARTEDTIRAHINARTASLIAGWNWEVLAQCRWLLRAKETGQPIRPNARESVDIGRICLSVPSLSSPR